jgi:hypothetical protein
MVIDNAKSCGIKALSQLVVMGAETGFGDTVYGGVLPLKHNYGCIRYMGTTSPWGKLSNGSVSVAGKDWYTWPTPQVGLTAFGLYLRYGVNGGYVQNLNKAQPDWYQFAATYYGSSVAGFTDYVARLKAIEGRIRTLADAAGLGGML